MFNWCILYSLSKDISVVKLFCMRPLSVWSRIPLACTYTASAVGGSWGAVQIVWEAPPMQEVCTVGQRVHVLGGLCLQMPTHHRVLNQLLLNGGESHVHYIIWHHATPDLLGWKMFPYGDTGSLFRVHNVHVSYMGVCGCHGIASPYQTCPWNSRWKKPDLKSIIESWNMLSGHVGIRT